MFDKPFELPFELRGKKIKSEKIIPTVYNVKNMIGKLDENGGDYSKLKPWEQRSYKHYNFEKIHKEMLTADERKRIQILREHILNSSFDKLGASPFDIYIVAYVSENIDTGRDAFIEYCLNNGMAGTYNSANAIYMVGKGDGVYLRILNDDGTVRDWEFMNRWVNG
ncbi:hypothetical protein [Candidatus Clostridium stratigraminis]|uniref:Uncharacterized protein n=1 Tax=Candidatus Clostridium stratigraminis TaxID=3381661 RepID=A0ABW8T7F2_9CLOT